MKTLVHLFLLFACALLLWVPKESVRAQGWVQIAHPCDSSIVCVHFLDKQGAPGIGFAGSQDGRVFLTANFGNSWTEAKTILQIHGPITSFVFKDPMNGWLTCRQGNKSGCYETRDGGNTWGQLGVPSWGDRFAIEHNPFNGQLFMSSPVDQFRSSSDNGASWNVIGPDFVNGITFSTPLIGAASCFKGGNLYTRDGGISWLKSSMATECWNPLATGPTVFFSISEATWQVYCSVDAGQTWSARGQLPKRPTGDIRGVCGQLYVQTESGFYYSADEGFTWHSLGGPGNQADTRFYSVGTVVYAGDQTGGIYKLHDIEHPPEGKLLVAGPVPALLTTDCGGVDTTIFLFGTTTCTATRLLGWTVDSTRSSPGLAVFQPAGNYEYIRPPGNRAGDTVFLRAQMPFTFTMEDTSFVPLHLRYRPSGASDSATITFHYEIGQYSFDSTIVLRASRDTRVSVEFDGTPLALSSKSGCLPTSGSFEVFNGKCDSVTIVSVHPRDSIHFRVNNKLPAVLLPFGSLPITVTGSGATKDTFTTTIDVVAEVAGVQSTFSVDARLIVQRDGPIAPEISRSVYVAATNICARRRYVVPFRNGGCYRMICDTVRWLSQSPALSILQQPTFPDTLNAGDADSLVLEYAPSVVSTNVAILDWKFTSGIATVDTQMQVHTEAYDLAKATLSQTAMEFDSILQCNESDRSVYIRNESCRSTELVRVVPSGDPSFVFVSPSVGNWIEPGDSVELRVHLRPRASGNRQDKVTLFYQDSSGADQSLTVDFHAYVIADVPHIEMSTAALVFDTVEPCSGHDTTIAVTNSAQCDTVTIGHASITGSAWFSVDTSQFPIVIPPGATAFVSLHLETLSDTAGAGVLHLLGSGVDSIITLAARTRPIAGLEVAASYKDNVFRAKLCSSDDKIFFLHNRTCGPVDISDIHVQGSSAYGIVTALKFPITLSADSSFPVELLFNADDTNSVSALLHFETADGRVVQDVPISSVTTTRPTVVRFGVRAMDGSSVAGRLPHDTVSFAVFPLDDVPDSLGLTSVSGGIAYDHDVLQLTSATGADGWSDPAPGSDNIRVSSSTPHRLSRSTPVAILHFTTFFAEPRSSFVALASPTLNDGDANYSRCVLTASATESATASIGRFCTDSLLGDALLGLPIALGSVEAQVNGSGGVLQVHLTANVPSVCHCTLADMRGAVVQDFGDYSARVGAQEFVLPVRLSSGVFEFILETAGRKIGRRVSLVK